MNPSPRRERQKPMSNPKLIVNLIVLILISLALISCSDTSSTVNQPSDIDGESDYLCTEGQSEQTKNNDRNPIIDIWKDLDGSVPIRGRSLYFRLYDDGVIEFDYEFHKNNGERRPYTVSLERIPPAKIPEEEFSKFRSLLDDLIKSKDVKKEYKPVGLTFDVLEKLTILLKANESERHIVLNDCACDVSNSRFEKKFPKPVIDLIKEIQLVRLDNCFGCTDYGVL